MIDHPAATPLDDAALTFCTAQGINPFACTQTPRGYPQSNQHAARPASAATISTYLDKIVSEPFFLTAIAEAISNKEDVKAAALAAVDAIRPDAIGNLFPDVSAVVEVPDMAGVEIAWLGGQCPVQAEGIVDGVAFYFRARGAHWEIWIGDQRRCFENHPDIWTYREPFRTWPEAGWMSDTLARRYISEGIARWRAEQPV